jgi:hypothetical protein
MNPLMCTKTQGQKNVAPCHSGIYFDGKLPSGNSAFIFRLVLTKLTSITA